MKKKIKISIFYCGGDTIPYLYGLVSGLVKNPDLFIDILDSDQSIGVFDNFKNVKFFNVRGNTDSNVSVSNKFFRIIKFYLHLLKYVTSTDSNIFHIQWFNRFQLLDTTLLPIYYRLLGKKLIYTAHNVNVRERNNTDTMLNRLTLKFFYSFVDHIIVHNRKSQKELLEKYIRSEDKVSVIKIGLNIAIPNRGVFPEEAKMKLNIAISKKTILFFGGIDSYKGLDILLEAFRELSKESKEYFLLIAGKPRSDKYIFEIKSFIAEKLNPENYSLHIGFIPDESVEEFFIAADCLVLPYRAISQSGVHVLSYSFGLPVLASDVGSFKDEDVIEGKTGYIFKPGDANDLKLRIEEYFNSSIYKNLVQTRILIKEWAKDTYSWDKIASGTLDVYKQILGTN